MDHVAIMKSSWNLIPKILAKEKTIESRWYKAKFAPWNRIRAGETIYFKNSGQPVTAKATVGKVLQFENLAREKIEEIIQRHGDAIGLRNKNISEWVANKAGKKYCILVFLKNAEGIVPFDIDKKGFGNAVAWLCVEDVKKIIKENKCHPSTGKEIKKNTYPSSTEG